MMFKIHSKVLLILLFSLFFVESHAKNKEKVVVDSISFKELIDITARRQPEYDQDGNPCSLVKVYAPLLENVKFSGDAVIKQSNVDECVWLWLKDRSSSVFVEARDMQPIQVAFSEFGYPRLHAKTTYQLNITIGHEKERITYRDVEIKKDIYKTKYVDSYHFDKNKLYWFLTYQCQSGSSLGFNVGVCESFGFFVAFNYYDGGFYDFQPEVDGPGNMYTYMGGTMFRLTPFLYLQTGLGWSYEAQIDTYFTCGVNLQFRLGRFVLGCGYNFNYMSVYYKRNVFLDGLNAQIGLNF